MTVSRVGIWFGVIVCAFSLNAECAALLMKDRYYPAPPKTRVRLLSEDGVISERKCDIPIDVYYAGLRDARIYIAGPDVDRKMFVYVLGTKELEIEKSFKIDTEFARPMSGSFSLGVSGDCSILYASRAVYDDLDRGGYVVPIAINANTKTVTDLDVPQWIGFADYFHTGEEVRAVGGRTIDGLSRIIWRMDGTRAVHIQDHQVSLPMGYRPKQGTYMQLNGEQVLLEREIVEGAAIVTVRKADALDEVIATYPDSVGTRPIYSHDGDAIYQRSRSTDELIRSSVLGEVQWTSPLPDIEMGIVGILE